MIFVNNSSNLQQNNLCPQQDLFFQPVVTEADTMLQGFLPKQVQNDYTIEVEIFSFEGDEFVRKSDFRALIGVTSSGQNYFNVQLSKLPPEEFFTVRVLVKNAGFIVFDKITEPYRRIPGQKKCFAVIDEFAWMIINKTGSLFINQIEFSHGQGLQNAGHNVSYEDGFYYVEVGCMDAVKLSYCYRGVTTEIDVPLLGQVVTQEQCYKPLIRLEGSYNCDDTVSGHYFGDPKFLLSYPQNDKNLRYKSAFYIYGEIKSVPTEIKKTSTFYGKPQRVEYVPKFELTGFEIFPVWKMLEIESLFSSRRFYVQGIEYIYRGGKIFDKDDIAGTCSWKLNASLEGTPKINDFSCIEDCNSNCTYYVIPGERDQAYYTENKELIGLQFSDLLSYFNSLPDIISVTDVPVSNFPCDIAAVIKIDTFGITPSFIYYRLKLNENRIYAKFDDCQNPTRVCEGMSICERPSGIVSSITSDECGTASGILQIIQNLNSSLPLAQVPGMWRWQSESTVIQDGSQMKLIISVYNSTITDNDDFSDTEILQLPSGYEPSYLQVDGDNTVAFSINTDGKVTASGNTTNQSLNFTFYYNL